MLEDNCEQVEVLKDGEQVAGCGVRLNATLCLLEDECELVQVLEDGEQAAGAGDWMWGQDDSEFSY